MWQIGDMVDVVAEAIYCPGKIVDVKETNQNKMFLVSYIGWDSMYDEWIGMKSNRIFKANSFVVKCKAWTRLNSSLCHWPCFVFIRPPVDDNEKSINWLKEEKRLVAVPCGPAFHQLKPYSHGVWISNSKIFPFASKKKVRVSTGMASKYAAFFSLALEDFEKSEDSINFEFELEGSYCTNLGRSESYCGVFTTPGASPLSVADRRKRISFSTEAALDTVYTSAPPPVSAATNKRLFGVSPDLMRKAKRLPAMHENGNVVEAWNVGTRSTTKCANNRMAKKVCVRADEIATTKVNITEINENKDINQTLCILDGDPICPRTGHKLQCCRQVVYCSVACQKHHWPIHKITCQKKVEATALNTISLSIAKVAEEPMNDGNDFETLDKGFSQIDAPSSSADLFAMVNSVDQQFCCDQFTSIIYDIFESNSDGSLDADVLRKLINAEKPCDEALFEKILSRLEGVNKLMRMTEGSTCIVYVI